VYNEVTINDMEEMKMISWQKIDHFTGEPYNRKSTEWQVVDYVAGDMRITTLYDGKRELTKGNAKIGQFKTLKAAKEYAETI
jgi:23S rRNA C2498 (ribose-2'-O)-methylase RlmM